MAVGVALKDRLKLGNAFMVVADITMDSSYDENGEPINPKALGLNVVYGLMAYPAGGYAFEYVHSANKLKAYSASGTEVVDKASTLSNVVVRVIAVGI